MATQEKEDVFQNMKFTSVKSNTRKESDVEFQDSENDPSSNIQDNGHTKSKFQKVLQSKGVWIGLLAILVVTLTSVTITGVVYSQLDSLIADFNSKLNKQNMEIDRQKQDIADHKQTMKLENDRLNEDISDLEYEMTNHITACQT